MPGQPRTWPCSGGRLRTVDVDAALLHELAERRKPLGRVHFGHVGRTQRGGRVQGSGSERAGLGGCIGYRCRVWAPQTARDQHEGSGYLAMAPNAIMVPSAHHVPRQQLQQQQVRRAKRHLPCLPR